MKRLALPLLLVAACGGAPEAPRTNVLWITIDTVRADRLGCYGYERPTSPTIDALAARGTRFERAYSTAPWTLPSVVSMLTGELPSEHGIYRGNRVLPKTADSLPKAFAEAGYATAASISGRLLMRTSGLDRHFELWDESQAKGMEHVSTRGVVQQSRHWLRRFAEEERPFFLFTHLFDAHYRFHDHEGIDFLPEKRGRLKGTEDYHEVVRRAESLSKRDLALLGGLYDEEIRHVDDGIAELLSELEAQGLADSTIVLVTADHGEELLERGWFGHTITLYDELVRVPLILAGPGVPAGRVERGLVSTREAGRALLELVGLAPGSPATHLSALLRGEPWEAEPAVLCEVDYEDFGGRQPKARKRAIVAGDHKLVVDELAGRVELYDLAADPLERTDLADSLPERVAELRARLEAGLAGGGAGEFDTREVDAAELEVLEGLGYAGGDDE